MVYFYIGGKELVLYNFREIFVELMKWKRWLKPGMAREGFGESGVVSVQRASELLPSNFTWVEKNTPLC